MWDIVVQWLVQLVQKKIKARYRSGTVYIVIAVDEDLLFCIHGLLDTVNGLVHIFHKPGAMQIFQTGSKKGTCFLKAFNSALHQQGAKHRVNFQGFLQSACFMLIGLCRRPSFFQVLNIFCPSQIIPCPPSPGGVDSQGILVKLQEPYF